MKRRNTPSKEAILNVLAHKGKAMSRDAIEQQLALEVDRATIYRVLNRFCEDGILHRIVAEDGKQYFAVCIKCEDSTISNNHFHFRCTQCQTIECLPENVHFSVPKGYTVEGVSCILTGICKECASV